MPAPFKYPFVEPPPDTLGHCILRIANMGYKIVFVMSETYFLVHVEDHPELCENGATMLEAAQKLEARLKEQ